MTPLRHHLRSTRVLAALSLGAVLTLGVSGTYALWSDSVPVSGVTISSGVLDLKVNTLDAVPAYTDLNLTGMVPGNTVAGILTVRNAGTIPLTYYTTASASNADAKGLGAALVVKVTADSTVTGTAPARTCAGTALATTGTTFAGNLVGAPATQRALAVGASETLCIQATLPTTAASTLQGASTNIALTFTASQ
jgi:predicted ribosomally synthesized peptide with SipW-like signal peptide